MHSYIAQLAQDVHLDPIEMDVLRQVDTKSPDDIDSLLRAFPSISDLGFRTPLISNAAAMQVSAAYASAALSPSHQTMAVAFGAEPPPFTSTPPGTTIGVSPPPPPPTPTLAATAIDLRLPHWPVKDQGRRGTCVAFGATACVEHLGAGASAARSSLSEQFLYWAIKDHSPDPRKTRDGTWLQFAEQMLKSDGICDEPLCPYSAAPVQPVSGPHPSTAAIAAAQSHLVSSGRWSRKPSGAAGIVLKALQAGRLVAISLPVFSDPALPQGPTNWTTIVANTYGRILNPPPRSIVSGGHCVCVTGFVPDASEPLGGYFIVRNSWGTLWAASAPTPSGSHAPEPGYGEVSATYVETYCWELLQL